MTDQQPTPQPTPPPAARTSTPVPLARRHWDGNGWTGSTAPVPAARSGMPPTAGADPELGRTAS